MEIVVGFFQCGFSASAVKLFFTATLQCCSSAESLLQYGKVSSGSLHVAEIMYKVRSFLCIAAAGVLQESLALVLATLWVPRGVWSWEAEGPSMY